MTSDTLVWITHQVLLTGAMSYIGLHHASFRLTPAVSYTDKVNINT